MRVYRVKKGNKSLIVAAHNPHQAGQVSKLTDAEILEINIVDPVIICQENTPTGKSVSTSGK
jgi:hypothetical protein